MNKRLKSRRAWVAATYYESRCYVCEKPFGRYFSFHHFFYPRYWKRHSDFSNNDQYDEYVLDRIVEHPGLFALLCRGCYHLVTITQRIGDQGRFERLVGHE